MSDVPDGGRAPDADEADDVPVPDPDRVRSRAEALLPEEKAVGSDDPQAQAEEILAESDERTSDRVAPGGEPVEQRRSEDTVEPID
jgi:hypothetical protein